MSESRHLVLKRHPKAKGHLVLCDEETGLPLAGQLSVQMICHGKQDGDATITVTFEAFGGDGVRLVGDEPRVLATK